VTAADFDINDTTAPSVTRAIGITSSRLATISFSEPVTVISGADVSHYSIQPAIPISAAKVSADGRSVSLELGQTLAPGVAYKLTVNGVTDLSVNANATNVTLPLAPLAPVYSSLDAVTFDGKTIRGVTKVNQSGLPTEGTASWTINMFVNIPQTLGELTMIGGFGSGRDDAGSDRFLIKFHDKIHFWGSNVDITASEAFDIGKWQMVTISYDGSTIRMYKNGALVGSEAAKLSDALPDVRIGTRGPWSGAPRFAGQVAGFTIWNAALPPEFILTMLGDLPK
jgi:hypothetical protein